MGDFRADIKLKMDIMGTTYSVGMNINYVPDSDGCDRRIIEWFGECWDKAYARHQESMWHLGEEQRKRDERKEYERLRAKYEKGAKKNDHK